MVPKAARDDGASAGPQPTPKRKMVAVSGNAHEFLQKMYSTDASVSDETSCARFRRMRCRCSVVGGLEVAIDGLGRVDNCSTPH